MGEIIRYIYNSGSSGFLSSENLAKLVSYNTFDGTCDENESNIFVIWIVIIWSVIFFLGVAYSFISYNIPQARNAFGYQFVKSPTYENGNWHDPNWWKSVLETLAGISIASTSIIWTSNGTYDVLNKQVLCHLGSIPLPAAVSFGLAIQSGVSYFFVNGILTLGAVYERNSGAQSQALTELLDQVPEFKKWYWKILYDFVTDSVVIACNGFLAPIELFGVGKRDFAYYPIWLTLAIVGFRIELFQDFEGLRYELEARIKEKLAAEALVNEIDNPLAVNSSVITYHNASSEFDDLANISDDEYIRLDNLHELPDPKDIPYHFIDDQDNEVEEQPTVMGRLFSCCRKKSRSHVNTARTPGTLFHRSRESEEVVRLYDHYVPTLAPSF